MKKNISRFLMVIAILAATVGCDQGTKIATRGKLPMGQEVTVVGNFFILVHAENQGAFLSLGANLAPGVRDVLLGAVPLLIIVCVAGFLLLRRGLSPMGTVALALVLGGGVGNLLDRLTRGGFVTDFMNAGIGRLRTGVFNFADLFLMAGIALYLVTSLRAERREKTGGGS